MLKQLLTGMLFFCAVAAMAQPAKVLVVVAHPDDETGMAATIFKITKEQGGIVDQMVITNGEAGYKYSLVAEDYYHLKLSNEKVGREHLPQIRKQELINAGRIIGIRNHFFLDQLDSHYGIDERDPLDTSWNVPLVTERLKEILQRNRYDYIFCLVPDSGTHGGHKAATILALRTVATLKEKPVILGVSIGNKTDTVTRTFTMLKDRPETRISRGQPSFSVDRTVPFGYNNKLNYKIIVNWEIAEHKSQGTMQTFMNGGDYERYWYFDINDPSRFGATEAFFRKLGETTLK